MKNLCLFTMPRSGSELVMRHLTSAHYADADEMLGFFNAADSNIVQHEFEDRLRKLEQRNNFAVKAFISSDFFISTQNVQTILDTFNVVFLLRKDKWRSALSNLICMHINFYHVTNISDGLNEAKRLLAGLKFKVSTTTFKWIISNHFRLEHIAKANPHFKTVYFEDIRETPTSKLNSIFNLNVKEQDFAGYELKPFIDNHEAHIENLDELKEIYNTFCPCNSVD